MRLIRLEIELLPGVRGPFTLEFGGDVDLVLGPNTSGKSSLVRAVLGLLWPGGPDLDGHWLRAEFRTAAGPLVAERRPGAGLRWLRDGVETTAPDLPAGHLADCYRLGLRDLTAAGGEALERTLAAEIRRQMAGGFDLDLDAAELCGLRPRDAAGRRDELRLANQAVEAIRREYEALELRRRERGELEAELAAARGAAGELERLQAARDRLAAVARHRQAVAALADFPAVLARLDRQDPAALAALLESRERLAQALATSGRRLEQAQAELAELRLPPRAETSAAGEALEVAIAAWRAAAAELAQAEAEARGRRDALAETRRRLPDRHPDAPPLEREAIGRLARLWIRHQGETAREAAARRVAEELELAPTGGGALPWLLLAGIGAVAGLVAALPVGLAAAPRAALAVAGLAVLTAAGRLAVARRTARELSGRLGRRLQAAGAQARQERTETERQQAELLDAAGLGRDLEDIQVLHDLEAAAAVAAAVQQVIDAEGRRMERRDRQEAAAARARALAAGLGLSEPATVDDAETTLRHWRRRLERARELADRIGEETARGQDTSAALAHAADQLAALCRRLDLDPADPRPADLAELAARREGWELTRDELKVAAAQLAQFGAPAPDLQDLDDDALAARLEDRRTEAARQDELQAALHDLVRDLDEARRSRRLEAASGQRDAARDALAAVRDRDRQSALTGWLLEDLRAVEDTASRPPVLTRAAELFARFTGRRYALRVTAPADGPSEFLAHDGLHDRDLGLAHLSDGTRTQLLLAVRLAFLLQVEGELRPPWFLDEALTTSDPGRFAATAAALAEAAAEHGRQLIYLTSQPADAGAWRGALLAAGLAEPGVIDLARVRSLAGVAPAAALAASGPPPPPAAAGLGVAEYGRRLGIAALDPWQGDGAQPLFWLMRDDLELLEALLTAGAATVGIWEQAREMLVRAGVIPAARAAEIEVRARLLAAFASAWRRGRGRPVTPELVRGLNENWTAKVLEALPELGWNAAALADAVADKRIPRFTPNRAAPLLEHLREAGCLDERPVLDLDGVMREVVDAFESLPGERRPSLAEARGLVAGWWTAAGGDTGAVRN